MSEECLNRRRCQKLCPCCCSHPPWVILSAGKVPPLVCQPQAATQPGCRVLHKHRHSAVAPTPHRPHSSSRNRRPLPQHQTRMIVSQSRLGVPTTDDAAHAAMRAGTANGFATTAHTDIRTDVARAPPTKTALRRLYRNHTQHFTTPPPRPQTCDAGGPSPCRRYPA